MAIGEWATRVQLLEQTDPPRHPCEILPTMYDLPSEDPQEPGLPDEFHDYQPQLLRETFQPPHYMPDHFFVGTDLNLYYLLRHPGWYNPSMWPQLSSPFERFFVFSCLYRFSPGAYWTRSYTYW